jgi:HAD superfamily hydrolase (TIGR01459 family)
VSICIFNHLADAVGPYDGVILDVWGCLHEGGAIFAHAAAALNHLHESEIPVVLLSNAPRRASRVADALAGKGLAPGLVRAILTSGDSARAALRARETPWAAKLGKRAYHLGPARDEGLLEGLDYTPSDDLGSADFILCTGLDGPEERVADYEPILTRGTSRGLPLICANPDKAVRRNGQTELCAGTLAARYAELGGMVHEFGKPHGAVYGLCLEALGITRRDRVLAIGDGPETDIRGAADAGIDSLLVTGGLLAEQLSTAPGTAPEPAEIETLSRAAGALPTAAIARMIW